MTPRYVAAETYADRIRPHVTQLLTDRRAQGSAPTGMGYTLLLPADAPRGLGHLCGLRVVYAFDVDQPTISDEPIPWQPPRERDIEPVEAFDGERWAS